MENTGLTKREDDEKKTNIFRDLRKEKQKTKGRWKVHDSQKGKKKK